MRITTWNVNGLRAAVRKGFLRHLTEISPDVLMLQEVRARPEQLPEEIRNPEGWQVIWNPAERPGYSGTAVWSRFPIDGSTLGMGRLLADEEGRLLTVMIRGIQLSCVYLPSGSSGEARQKVKDLWMRKFRRWVNSYVDGGPCLFGGDLNIAHSETDIYYAKSNEKTSGFLPHERAWFGRLLGSGWHDLVREQFGGVQGPYSWWSNRGRARELDRGWRIDYLLSNAAARQMVTNAVIHREAALEISDHAPVTIDLQL